MIEFNQVCFGYPTQKPTQKLLTDFSVQFKAGQIIGLMGRNGAGKSSLLNLIAGLNFANQGEITTLGHRAKQRTAEMLAQIFYLPEQFELPYFTGQTYQALYRSFYPNFDQADFENNLATLDIPLNKPLNKLSMGQQKKFLLAFGLACHCPINLLDEPTNGLDIPAKSLFRKLIASAADSEKLFIISTHQVKDIEKLIDHACMIDQGQLKLDQSMEQLSQTLKMHTTDQLTGKEIYTQEMGLGQYAVMTHNTEATPSAIDLELLFNACMADYTNRQRPPTRNSETGAI